DIFADGPIAEGDVDGRADGVGVVGLVGNFVAGLPGAFDQLVHLGGGEGQVGQGAAPGHGLVPGEDLQAGVVPAGNHQAGVLGVATAARDFQAQQLGVELHQLVVLLHGGSQGDVVHAVDPFAHKIVLPNSFSYQKKGCRPAAPFFDTDAVVRSLLAVEDGHDVREGVVVIDDGGIHPGLGPAGGASGGGGSHRGGLQIVLIVQVHVYV